MYGSMSIECTALWSINVLLCRVWNGFDLIFGRRYMDAFWTFAQFRDEIFELVEIN